jgi:putative transposase
MIGILQQAETGAKAADLCRQHGLGEATFYQWKAKYGGLQVSDAQKLRRLEEENTKLKRVVADLPLDNVALKDLLGKKWGSLRPRKRQWSISCANTR